MRRRGDEVIQGGAVRTGRRRAGRSGSTRATIVLVVAALVAAVLAVAPPTPAAVAQSAPAQPQGDIVFVVDESGSMAGEIDEVQARLGDIVAQLEASGLDFRLGLVGYAGGNRLYSPLTDDMDAFAVAVNQLNLDGANPEAGFSATVFAMSDALGHRPDAGTCEVLISDEDADGPGNSQFDPDFPESKNDALAALAAREAVFVGAVGTDGSSEVDYGPEAGSLAAETRGALFPIGDFTDDAGPLLESLLTTCIETANQELPPIANAGPDQSVIEAEVATLDATGSALGYIDTVPGFNSVWDAARRVLPDEVCPPWTLTDTTAPEPYVLNGALRFSTPSTNSNDSYYSQVGADLLAPRPDPLVIEARMRETSSTNTAGQVRRGAAIDIAVGANVGNTVYIGDDRVLLLSAANTQGAFANVDTASFHDFRVEVDADGAIRVFRDGALLISGHTFTAAGNYGTDPRIAFGDISPAARGASEWEYVRHNASAAASACPDPLSYRWEQIGASGPPVTLSSSGVASPSFRTVDDGTYDFRLTVTAPNGHSSTDDVRVTVTNAAPVVSPGGVSFATEKGVSLVTATFTDPGVVDTHTATVDWGDGTDPVSVPVLAQGTGWGEVQAAHTYSTDGTFTVTVTLSDDDGGTDTAEAISVEATDTEVVVLPGSGVALWADSTTAKKTLQISGSGHTIIGVTHTNHELKVTGSGKTFTGATEYVTSAQISGSGHTFTPPVVQVPAAGPPVTFDIADYQPGGRAALAAGADFHDMSSVCGPKWNPSGTLAPGVYWVPCDVQFSGHLASSGPITIAASGDIHVSGHAQAFVAPYIDNLLFISADTSGSAIKTSGSDGTFTGFFYAPDGGIDVSGSDQTFTCGLIGDTIKITGSRGTFDAAGCPGGTAGTTIDEIAVPAPPLWVPTLDLTHTADRADVAPGQTIAYTTDTTNDGTTLVIPGIIAARNLDSTATATIDGATVLVEYQDAVTSNWVTLGTNTGPTPTATLASEPTPEDGVVYPTTGDRIAGTTIDAGAPASWAAAAVINLDPAQVTMLLDPAQVSGLRASATLTVSPSQLATRQVIGFDPELLDTLRTLGSDIDDTNVTVGLPDGTETIHTPTTIAALATLAPGDTATVASAYAVAAPVPPAPEESPGDYTSRLAAIDGTVLVSTGFAHGQATIGPVLAPQQATLTTVRLPVLETAVTAPERVAAAAVANWAIQITNTGTAPATAIAVEIAIAGVGPLPLVGVPASLAPGQSATVTASWLVPTDRFEPVVALSRVTWGDGAANTYGPLDFSQTSEVDTAPAGGVTISGVTGRFFDATATHTAFTATPADTPIFEQAFPAIVFNPAEGTIPAQPAGIDDTTRPFTNVAIAANGRATGTVVAQGNGEEAGVGDLAEFQAVFDGTLTFAEAGTHNLTVTADAGFVLGIDSATRVAGELVAAPAATAFEGFDVVAAHNTPTPVPVAYQVTISVPAPGDYPFELDYFDTNDDTLTLVLSASAGQARSLWLGNDMVGDVFQTDLNGAVLTQLPATPRTGVAHDGARLYVGDNAGNIEARSADGTTVLDTFNIPRTSGTAAEDLAWDTTRQRLWRIDNNNRLRKINPVTETQEAVYNLPTSDTVLGTLGGIGVDYDEARDVLYVSYCKKTPCQDNGGLVQTVDPDTGTVTSNLFRTTGEFTGGLAYDPADDTLWVGRHFDVAHYTLNGTFLGAFPDPPPAPTSTASPSPTPPPQPSPRPAASCCPRRSRSPPPPEPPKKSRSTPPTPPATPPSASPSPSQSPAHTRPPPPRSPTPSASPCSPSPRPPPETTSSKPPPPSPATNSTRTRTPSTGPPDPPDQAAGPALRSTGSPPTTGPPSPNPPPSPSVPSPHRRAKPSTPGRSSPTPPTNPTTRSSSPKAPATHPPTPTRSPS